MTLKSVTDANFAQDVLQSSLPVVVDFSAASSGPCREVLPSLEAIAAEYPATIEIVTLDIDANPVTTARYNVMSLPTLNVFQGGELVQTIVGALPKAALEHDLAEFLQS